MIKKSSSYQIGTMSCLEAQPQGMWLKLLNYYSNFLTKLSSKVKSLYSLLQKIHSWQWGSQEAKSFQEVKELLISSCLLLNLRKKLVLLSLGKVLSHVYDDSSEQMIGCASHTLALSGWKNIFSDGHEVFSNYILSQTIPLIYLWPTIHIIDR